MVVAVHSGHLVRLVGGVVGGEFAIGAKEETSDSMLVLISISDEIKLNLWTMLYMCRYISGS